MQPVLPDPTPSPQASLSIAIETFLGVNQIRRSLGRSVALWIGTTSSDRNMVIAPSTSETIAEEIQAFVLITNGPVSVTVNSKTLTVTSLLVLDEAITSGGLVINNTGTASVEVHLTYLNPSS